MFNDATRGLATAARISTDNDPLFTSHRWLANLRILDAEEVKTVPYVPRSHPFVERLIGSIRREFLDHVFFWNERDLERRLRGYQRYFNEDRAHASLDGKTPLEKTGYLRSRPAPLSNYAWKNHCGGMFQLPPAA